MRLLTTVVMGGLLLCVGPALADTLCLVASPTQEELAKEAVRKCRPGDSLCGLAAVLVLTGTAAAKPSSGDPPAGRAIPQLSTTDGAPVELAAQPGSEADKLARQLMAREIARVHAEGTDPLVLIGMGRLKDADELLFVQLQSPGDCGSAGCSTVSFRYEGDQWIRIMDTVSGTVQIAQSRHRGMPDLIVNGNRLVWDGTKYPG
jgi:hypothetical protein